MTDTFAEKIGQEWTELIYKVNSQKKKRKKVRSNKSKSRKSSEADHRSKIFSFK